VESILSVGWREKELHTKCGRDRVGNSVQMDVRQAAAVSGDCNVMADHGFLMLEQRFPRCAPRIHDHFPGYKCIHFSSGYFGVYLFLYLKK